MTCNIGPNQGLGKPTTGPEITLTYALMGKGKTRRRKTPSRLRAVIAINVANRAALQFKGHPNIPVAIKDASGGVFSKSTVQRIMDAKVGTSLEQLDGLARALDLAPYQLLMENLDARNPQVVKGAMVDDQALYRRIAREAVSEARALYETSPGVRRSSRAPKPKNP